MNLKEKSLSELYQLKKECKANKFNHSSESLRYIYYEKLEFSIRLEIKNRFNKEYSEEELNNMAIEDVKLIMDKYNEDLVELKTKLSKIKKAYFTKNKTDMGCFAKLNSTRDKVKAIIKEENDKSIISKTDLNAVYLAELNSFTEQDKVLNVDKIESLDDVKRILKFLNIKATDNGRVISNGFEEVRDLFEY